MTGKFYPRNFRPWADFATVHAETFETFTTTFADQGLFPPVRDIEGWGRWMTLDGPADEQDMRSFVYMAIEKPASTIMARYLDVTSHPTISGVYFRNNAYGVLADKVGFQIAEMEHLEPPEPQDPPEPQEPPPKRRNTVKSVGIPDQWAFAKYRNGKDRRIIVGEYKAAHKLPEKTLRRVLSTHPGDDFFVRAIAESKKNKDTASATEAAAAASSGPSAADSAPTRLPTGKSLVAQVICQAYHYMISSGLEFGYVSSGDGLIFLRVLENDPRTLYYFWNVFPVNPHPDAAAGRPPERTALAYMASLCKWALETTPRRASWSDTCNGVLRRWPQPYDDSVVVPLFPTLSFPPSPGTDGGDDGEGGSGGGGAGPGGPSGSGSGSAPPRPAAAQSALKRPRSAQTTGSTTSKTGAAADEDYASVFRQIVIAEPTLPYCTQACLRGLCDGLPLDDKCPNAGLHRAARATRATRGGAAPGHALTADAVRSRVVAQLAAHLEKDCMCLDEDGCYGRFGALFKITVTGYGYTFVAKGVQAAHARVLQHEQRVYGRLRAQQGRLVPVCLGLVTLARPFPLHTCAAVAHMLLLSYAGPALHTAAGRAAVAAAGVDAEAEAERTEHELAAATGLWNDDVRAPNMAWSDEVGRVLQFDFDQAIFLPEADEVPEADQAPGVWVVETPPPDKPQVAGQGSTAAGGDGGDKAYDEDDANGRPAKRARAGT